MRKIRKRQFAILAAAVLCIGIFAACGKKPGEPVVTDDSVKIENFVSIDNAGYTITNLGQGEYRVVWDNSKAQNAGARLGVSNYTSKYKSIKLTYTTGAVCTVGIWCDDRVWKEHTAISVGTEEWIISIPNAKTLADRFHLIFYFDAASAASLGGDLTLKIEFLKTSPNSSDYDKPVDDLENWN